MNSIQDHKSFRCQKEGLGKNWSRGKIVAGKLLSRKIGRGEIIQKLVADKYLILSMEDKRFLGL